MKYFIIVAFCTLLLSCSEQKQNQEAVTSYAGNQNADTVLINDKFLVTGKKGDPVDYIPAGQSYQTFKSLKDTLFTNNEVLILGDLKSMKVFMKFKPGFNFADYTADTSYKGKLAEPDFTKMQLSFGEQYCRFVTDKCKQTGINFAGHYTVIEQSCGAMCAGIYIVDRITGRVFDDLSTNDGKWGFQYQNNSKLLIANSEILKSGANGYISTGGKLPEFYLWEKDNLKKVQ